MNQIQNHETFHQASSPLNTIKFKIFLILLFTTHLGWSSINLSEYHLLNGCKIYAQTGYHVRSFPGDRCLFFDDGSFVSSSDSHLRYFSKTSQLLWELKGHFHHQLNLSNDGKRLLTLSSVITKKKDKKYRVDKFLIISLAGTILHEQTSDILFEQTGKSGYDYILTPNLKAIFDADFEFSHFNSIYEIPKVDGSSSLKYLEEGNIVINGLLSGVFILTPDLKKVVRHLDLPFTETNQAHDVQILQDGSMLYFSNWTKGFPHWNRVSSIHIMNLKTMELLMDFTAKPEGLFHSPSGGGVQRLNEDLILFSGIFHGTYVYSRSKNKIVLSTYGTHVDGGRLIPAQQIKSKNLDTFLSHWK